jgi:diguanylate cyclase (GGDEF)-like protein/PAS domain S-box-containing protein
MSLKTRLTLFTLAIFVAGIWTLAFYASRMLRQDLQALLAEQQSSALSLLAERIDQELTGRFHALESVADNLDPALMAHPAALQRLLEQRTHLQSMFNGGVLALRPDATAIASVPISSHRVGVNYQDQENIMAALKEGKVAIGRPVLGRKLRAPLFGMTVPIRDKRGKVIGALSGAVNLGLPNFLDTITANRYGKTGGYLLIAPQYRLIVTATDKSRIMEVLPPAGRNAVIDRLLEGSARSEILLNPLGEEVLVSTRRVPLAGWNVSARLSTEEAFAPVMDMQRRLFAAAAVFTVLAGILIWWISQQMIRRQLAPMLKTSSMLSDLSDPDQLPQSLAVTSQDEIGQLFTGFNHLLGMLGQGKAMLRQLFDTSTVAIFLLDRDGRLTQANQHMADMFGCPLDQLEGSLYIDLVHPSQRAEGLRAMGSLLSGQIGTADLQRLYVRSDGTEFWGHLTAKPFADADGRKRGLLTVISDITDLKRAEAAVRESEARYRRFLADLPVGIVVTQDGLIRYLNRTILEMIGYSEDELMGRPFLPLIDEADRGRVLALHEKRMRGEAVEPSYPVRMVRKSGEVRQWQAYVNTIAWDGKPSGLGSFIDMTERRQMEEQIRQLAFYDPLTQLGNRRLLNDRLLQTMAGSKRSGCYCALLLMDLDGFKSLNDSQGHDVGDLLLVEAAQRLKGAVREVDTVARFGGDEFVVVLAELEVDKATSTRQACTVAEKVLAILAQPYRLAVSRPGQATTTIEHQCTASVGVAIFISHEASPEDVLKWADMAMYQAKGAGKNLVRVYDPASARP